MLVSYDNLRDAFDTLLIYCRVTRMLVSYDIQPHFPYGFFLLQGHQNVGELRQEALPPMIKHNRLQGHQNVGELRPT